LKTLFQAFPIALRMIFKDPVNLLLAIFPTLIALALYLFTIFYVYSHSDKFVSFFKGYIYTSNQADLLSKILTAVLIILVFVFMSWTFVFIAGVLSAPFNVILSGRIERKLVLHVTDTDRKEVFHKVRLTFFGTITNELKKVLLISLVAVTAFFLNLFPLLYPLGIFLFSILISIQFIDYSWSRHDMHFSQCLKDVMVNVGIYGLGGFFFLLLITIPIINAFIPTLATSYFTVLWLYRQKKIL